MCSSKAQSTGKGKSGQPGKSEAMVCVTQKRPESSSHPICVLDVSSYIHLRKGLSWRHEIWSFRDTPALHRKKHGLVLGGDGAAQMLLLMGVSTKVPVLIQASNWCNPGNSTVNSSNLILETCELLCWIKVTVACLLVESL